MSDPNAEVAVNVRIEGRNSTIFDGTVLTKGKVVSTSFPPVVTNRADGTNGNEYPFPVPTCTSALVDSHFAWDATFDPNLDDFLINRIGKDIADPNSEFWQLTLNFKQANLGGQMRVTTGDSVLWALISFDKNPGVALRLKGPLFATVNKSFKVTVIDGETCKPVEGATVGSQKTDNNGEAVITFTIPGEEHLKSDYPDRYVRSNGLTITVS